MKPRLDDRIFWKTVAPLYRAGYPWDIIGAAVQMSASGAWKRAHKMKRLLPVMARVVRRRRQVEEE